MTTAASRRLGRRLGVLALVALVAACGGDALTLPGDGVAAKLEPVGGNGQVATAGEMLPDSLVVQVLDSKGVPVQGAVVRWSTADDGGVSAAAVTSGVDGRAGVLRRLGTTDGEQTTLAELDGTVEATFAFTSTATAIPPERLALATQPSSSVRRRQPLAQQPVVQIQDENGAPLAESGVAVSAAIASGDGRLAGTTVQPTDAAGRAVFTDLAIVDGTGPHTLIFAADGRTSTTSTPIDVQVPRVSPSQSDVESSTASITASSGSQQATLTVTVRDEEGLPYEGAAVRIAVSGSGNTIGQPPAPTSADGIATATVSSTKAESKTITVTVDGTELSGTERISVTPAAAAASATTADVPDGYTFRVTTITVRARDQFDNPVTRGGATVTVRVAGNPAAVTDHGDGRYTASFYPFFPGTYPVEITLDGHPIAGSPYESVIEVP